MLSACTPVPGLHLAVWVLKLSRTQGQVHLADGPCILWGITQGHMLVRLCVFEEQRRGLPQMRANCSCAPAVGRRAPEGNGAVYKPLLKPKALLRALQHVRAARRRCDGHHSPLEVLLQLPVPAGTGSGWLAPRRMSSRMACPSLCGDIRHCLRVHRTPGTEWTGSQPGVNSGCSSLSKRRPSPPRRPLSICC